MSCGSVTNETGGAAPVQCTRAPTERHGSPAEMVLGERWVTLPGFTEMVVWCSQLEHAKY